MELAVEPHRHGSTGLKTSLTNGFVVVHVRAHLREPAHVGEVPGNEVRDERAMFLRTLD